MQKHKDVLTTGQVAKLCNVAPRTVSKWFDSGTLRGYRIPGSKDRRIPLNQLIAFMKFHGMPLNGLANDKPLVLVLDNDSATNGVLGEALCEAGEFEVSYAQTAFEAGVAVESLKPAVMVVDVSLPDVQPQQLCRDLRSTEGLESLKLIATSGGLTEGQGQSMLQAGFDAYLPKPFEVDHLAKVIVKVLA